MTSTEKKNRKHRQTLQQAKKLAKNNRGMGEVKRESSSGNSCGNPNDIVVSDHCRKDSEKKFETSSSFTLNQILLASGKYSFSTGWILMKIFALSLRLNR